MLHTWHWVLEFSCSWRCSVYRLAIHSLDRHRCDQLSNIISDTYFFIMTFRLKYFMFDYFWIIIFNWCCCCCCSWSCRYWNQLSIFGFPEIQWLVEVPHQPLQCDTYIFQGEQLALDTGWLLSVVSSNVMMKCCIIINHQQTKWNKIYISITKLMYIYIYKYEILP